MKTDWLCKRISSAKRIGRGRILNKILVCNKRSKDSSGKANLKNCPGGIVWGVLYEIVPSDLSKLDKVEEGYQRIKMCVQTDEDKSVVAEVYISAELTTEAIPFDWYKKILICGAQEHQLPVDYIEYLKKLPAKRDSTRAGYYERDNTTCSSQKS